MAPPGCLLVWCSGAGGCVSCVTDHILVIPAESLDGVADVSVPLEAFVSVVGLGRVPGEGALD
jgi:hypothetical protein